MPGVLNLRDRIAGRGTDALCDPGLELAPGGDGLHFLAVLTCIAEPKTTGNQ